MNKFNIKYADKLSGRQFEFYCAKILWLFFNRSKPLVSYIKVTQATNDHGADIIAKNSDGAFVFQCKHVTNATNESIGYRALEETAAGMRYYHTNSGAVITNGYITKRATREAKHMKIYPISRNVFEYIIKGAYQGYLRHKHQTLHVSKHTADLLDDIEKQYKMNCRITNRPARESRDDLLKDALRAYDEELYLKNGGPAPTLMNPLFDIHKGDYSFFKKICEFDAKINKM